MCLVSFSHNILCHILNYESASLSWNMSGTKAKVRKNWAAFSMKWSLWLYAAYYFVQLYQMHSPFHLFHLLLNITSVNFVISFLGEAPTSICHFFHPSVCRAPYLRNHTSSDHNFWNTCKMMISSGVFFIFSKFWFFRLLGG